MSIFHFRILIYIIILNIYLYITSVLHVLFLGSMCCMLDTRISMLSMSCVLVSCDLGVENT
jgi:hypothetical protein